MSKIQYVPNTDEEGVVWENGVTGALGGNRHDNNKKKIQYKTLTLTELLNEYLKLNLDKSNVTNNIVTNPEFEIRFNTLNKNDTLTNMDYERVIKNLKGLNYKCAYEQGLQMLRMSTNKTNWRVEIMGYAPIESYCKYNDLKSIIETFGQDNVISFQSKNNIMVSNMPIGFTDFADKNIRISLQNEKEFTPSNIQSVFGTYKNILDEWSSTDKSYRLMNRVVYEHDDYPFRVELSIVTSLYLQSKIFDPVKLDKTAYEIEIELDNPKIKSLFNLLQSQQKTTNQCIKEIENKIKKGIKHILSALQETEFPVDYSVLSNGMTQYSKLIKTDTFKLKPINFIGPSSITLERVNILPPQILTDNNLNATTIAEVNKDGYSNYTVTDKADGERRMLFIDGKGTIYFITTNMKFIYAGFIDPINKHLLNTLIDGEWIQTDKHNKYLNKYMPFDLYFYGGKDVRHYPLINNPLQEMLEEKSDVEEKSRTQEMYNIVTEINNIMVQSAVEVATENSNGKGVKKGVKKLKNKLYFKSLEAKIFYTGKNIFEECAKLLKKCDEHLFPYNNDGLILTPAYLGVGGLKKGETGPLKRITWTTSFKYKPAEYNTIDFSVQTIKLKNGEDKISSIFSGGIATANPSNTNIEQYKTVVLKCTFSESENMKYHNPCKQLLEGDYPKKKHIYEHNHSKPIAVQFSPTHPVNDNAGIAHVMLTKGDDGTMSMVTTEGDVFYDNTIVEWSFDVNAKIGWQWKPLRVRNDKTNQMITLKNNFGNYYNVANNIWHSIHYPVTTHMISTGYKEDGSIPSLDETSIEEIYYTSTEKSRSLTPALRDFHNLFVKHKLIMVGNNANTLIDFACGKAGDLPKWIHARIKFVLGLDIANDNLENRKNGACVRVLDAHKNRAPNNYVPDCVFVRANSELNIRNGDAEYTQNGKDIISYLSGTASKNSETKDLGKVLYKNHGIVSNGADITSCQFALHYFFKNTTVLQSFMVNVCENTALSGYFVGTAFNGSALFKLLEPVAFKNNIVLTDQDVKIWEVVKQYKQSTFPNDETSVGYQVDIYQASIGKLIGEYLVNFDYFISIMDKYGFEPLSDMEAKSKGFTRGIGSFADLFDDMNQEIADRPVHSQNIYKNAANMTEIEQQISFLNNYFIFKKVRNINAADVVLFDKDTSIVENVNVIDENDDVIDDNVQNIIIKDDVEEDNNDNDIVEEDNNDNDIVEDKEVVMKIPILLNPIKLTDKQQIKADKAAEKLKEKEDKAAAKLKEKEDKAEAKLKEKDAKKNKKQK